MSDRLVIVAGGGTGGHLFPGLAVAEALADAGDDRAVAFACSRRPIDAEILEPEGAAFEPVSARPFAGGVGTRLRFAAGWLGSVRDAKRAVRALMDRTGATPERTLVLATGGFVAPPVVRAARALGLTVWTLNLDAVPGLANRRIARQSGRVLSVYPHRSWDSIPPVVRRSVMDLDATDARRALGLDPASPVLAVLGGSLGAVSLNRFVLGLLEEHGGPLRDGGWQLVHQTGAEGHAEIRNAADRAGLRAVVQPFFGPGTEIDSAAGIGAVWAAADIAIARAGAGNVAEAHATRTPSVFLPYPYHRDDHQRHNAAPLVEAGGAVCLIDRVDRAANLAAHAAVVLELLGDAARREAMRDAIVGMGPTDGAVRIAAEIIESL